METFDQKTIKWFRDQIENYKEQQDLYLSYAEKLQLVLEKEIKDIAPVSIIETRTKTISSFADKLLRKKDLYLKNGEPYTDLCGGRVITYTQDKIKPICEFIENKFDVDWDYCIAPDERLEPDKFGYRSIHYIVKFKQKTMTFSSNETIEIPEELHGLRAEIQIRSILEHAWAVFSHEMSYKNEFNIPQKWERELASVAALLESADAMFSKIQQGLSTYASSYGAYLNEDQIEEKIKMYKIILEYDPHNYLLAHAIARLAKYLGQWDEVVRVLYNFKDSKYQPLLRDLGTALYKKNKDNPGHAEYKEGQRLLKMVSSSPYSDPDASCSLAGSYKNQEEDEKAYEFYRRAYEIDPYDPYALGNYLEYEMTRCRDVSLVRPMRPVIEKAQQRCREHIEVGINLPWAYFDLGKFFMLLEKPFDAFNAYAKAVHLSTHSWMIETSLKTLEKNEDVLNSLVGFEWACRLLLLGIVVKFPSKMSTFNLDTKFKHYSQATMPPVLIITGGCDANVEDRIRTYTKFLKEALSDFEGTVISGGTTAGVSGLAGVLQEYYPGRIKTIGYAPNSKDAEIDERYSEVYYTGGDDFSPLEPLQYWADILQQGVRPSDVKVVGVNGGLLAGAEFRMALAFGARLGLISGSGREADRLLMDTEWNNLDNLYSFSFYDQTAFKAFLS